MSTVLITGGTGFIGSRLAQLCREAGDSVRLLGQANTEAEEANLARLESDGYEIAVASVTDAAAVRDAVSGVDVVYHLAAAQHEAGRPDSHFREVNVTGTTNMLEASADAGIARFVHGSTIGVYAADRGTVRDDTPTEPDNIYGVTKLEAEGVVRSYADRVPTVTIRISETYGPGDRRLLKLFRGIEKGKYFHIGRSANLHHPVYVDDLAGALRRAAVAEEAVGATMVVPGYEALTTRRMVETIAETLEVRPPRLTVPLWPLWSAAVVMEKTMRPIGLQPPLHRRRMHFFIKSFEFAGATARRTLGYEPAVPFADGAKRTAAWYRQEGLL